MFLFVRSNSCLAATVLALVVLLSCGKKDVEVASPEVSPLVPGISQNLTRSDLAPTYAFDNLGPVKDPVVQKSVQVSGDTRIAFLGWAIDGSTKTPAGGVDVVVDEAPYVAKYGIARPDVGTFFKRPDYTNSGFELILAPGKLPKGPHSVSIRIISSDRKSYYQGPVVQFSVT
jgi:hypothetical protein